MCTPDIEAGNKTISIFTRQRPFLSHAVGYRGRRGSFQMLLCCGGNNLVMTFRNPALSLIHRSLPFSWPQFPIWTPRVSITVTSGTSVLRASTISPSVFLPLKGPELDTLHPGFWPYLWDFSCSKCCTQNSRFRECQL